MTELCPRCGKKLISPEDKYESPRTNAQLCKQCYKEDCVALTNEIIGDRIIIPEETRHIIREIVYGHKELGFESEIEFIMESIRMNLSRYKKYF